MFNEIKKKALLTEQEKEIVNNYLKTYSKNEAFKLAGVEVSTSKIYNFFNSRRIKRYISQQMELNDESLTKNEVLTRLARLARRLDTEDVVTKFGQTRIRQSIKDQIKALEILIKLMNIESDKNDLNVTIVDDILNDDISDQEIEGLNNLAGIEENES